MIMDEWKSFGPFLRQYVIVITVNLSVFGAGLGFAWTSPVLVKLSNETSPVLERPITENEGSWIVSIGFLSGLLGSFAASYLVDLIGRKYCFILSAVPRIGCYLFLYLANDVWMLLVGRFLVGLSDAFTFTSVPMYATEVASKEIRGGLGTVFQIFSSLGIVVVLSMGPYLDYYTLNKVILYIVLATSIPLMLLPDSPYYLYRKGKTDEAVKVLTFLRGNKSLANEELKEYQANSNEEKINLTEVLKHRTVLKGIAIVIVLGIGMQLTGYNALSFYLQTILVSTKTSVSSEMASVIIGLIQLTASLCTTLVIDRFGRKPILSITLLGMSVGLLGLGTFFYMSKAGAEIVGFLNVLPLFSLILVVYCFSAGLGSLTFPLMAELFDGRARPCGIFFGQVSSSVMIFLVVRFFAPLTGLIGAAATYWVFAVNSVLLCLFILYCVPETKGKTFTEIQATMAGRSKNIEKNGVVDELKL